MSADRSIRLFARLIPLGIDVTSEQGRRLALEMLSADGKTFHILAEGFEPNEPLTSYDRSEDEYLAASRSADASGSLRSFHFRP